MKVCLDTNVLVSGIYWGGVPGKVVDLWAHGRFELMVSPVILEEYIRVLREVGSRLESPDTEKWITAIIEKSSLVMTQAGSKRWSRDPDDDKFIQCALSSRAGHLVTGDEDLLSLKPIFPFKILSPAAFLKELPELKRK